ncbi:response regulator [Desulfovibrio inopinatus]|uniref:response regulator n=1 Tax=Desulfovibrio inopinatus TaxID=102109 RepID=UPI00040FE1BB|nr:response regulator [Desulfovibrio inopinatus]
MGSLLVVDDSLFQRMLLGKIAEECGFVVTQAKTGKECLESVAKAMPDAMLLDLNMPDMSGFEVLRSLHEAETLPKTVVITADIQKSSRERCEAYDLAGMLNKPVDEDQLRGILASLLKGA